MFSPSIDSKTFDWIPFHHTGDINYVALLHCPHVLQKLTGGEQRHYTYITRILQKTAFSLVKSRLALGSSSWLFDCLSLCGKWLNTLNTLYSAVQPSTAQYSPL